MMTRLHRLVLAAALLAAAGCGTSGARPSTPPEVRFRVRPSGQIRFTAVMYAGGEKHDFPGTVFTTSSDFDFYFENAQPPYGGTFAVQPDDLGNYGDLELILSVTGQTDQTVVADRTTHIAAVGSATSGATPTQEIRFEACVPIPPATDCSVASAQQVFGMPINATVGDPFISNVSFGTAPSVYYLFGAKDSVHGVFALQPSNGRILIAKLLINGQLQQTHSGDGDVTIQQNL